MHEHSPGSYSDDLHHSENSSPKYAHFIHDFPGRVPMQAQRSPDSRFLVLIAISAGDHFPWHSTTYIFSVAHHKIVSPYETIGASCPRTSCPRIASPAMQDCFPTLRTSKHAISFDRSMNNPRLRSPRTKVGGLYHFGRMVDKIRLHLRAGFLMSIVHISAFRWDWTDIFAVFSQFPTKN